MNNNMYPRQYTNTYPSMYNQQNMYDQIDGQIAQLNQMKEQIKNNNQQPAINQTFQLAPQSNSGLKIVNGIDDVKKELTIIDTPFINSDYSMLWIKNAKGDIRTYQLEEIKEKDEKDMIIDDLRFQINNLNNRLEEMRINEQFYDKPNDARENTEFNEPVTTKKSSNVSNVRTSKTK